MNSDIRISTALPTNPKIRKLQRKLGEGAVWALIQLWIFTANHRPDGKLAGLEAIDIEDIVSWNGNDGEFVDTLISIGLLECDNTDSEHITTSNRVPNREPNREPNRVLYSPIFRIHDWKENNPYANGSKGRKEDGKRNIFKRWCLKKLKKEHHSSFTKWLQNSYVIDLNDDAETVLGKFSTYIAPNRDPIRCGNSTPNTPYTNTNTNTNTNNNKDPAKAEEKKESDSKKVQVSKTRSKNTKSLIIQAGEDKAFSLLWRYCMEAGKAKFKGQSYELWRDIIKSFPAESIIFSWRSYIAEQRRKKTEDRWIATLKGWFEKGTYANHTDKWEPGKQPPVIADFGEYVPEDSYLEELNEALGTDYGAIPQTAAVLDAAEGIDEVVVPF